MSFYRKSRGGFTLVEIMIVVAIIGIIIAIAVPGFVRARQQSRMRACQENLVKIDGAKEQFALETNLVVGAAILQADLEGPTLYLKTWPLEPAGGVYTVGVLGADPVCTVAAANPGHSIPEIGTVVP